MTTSQDFVNASAAECAAALSFLLRGSFITRIEYIRTAWEIDFCLSRSEFAEQLGISISEVTLQAEAWLDTSIEADASIAKLLVECTAHIVEAIQVESDTSDVSVLFTNGVSVTFPGRAGPVDEVWTFFVPSETGLRRRFGEACLAQSYFGDLGLDSCILPLAARI